MFLATQTFTALDFETANRYRNSACAVGLVRVERGRIVRRAYHLIRPPFRLFEFSYLHGIDWTTVCREPSFEELWPRIRHFFDDVEFVAAHNASFDAGVLSAVCSWYGIDTPEMTFRCTVRMARSAWGLYPTTLDRVARHLGLPLNHHHAGSDAEACAGIVLRALAS